MSWQVSQNGVRDGTGIDAPEQESLPVIDDVALDDEVESAQTLGQLLRQERELRDIPLDRIEQATRIRSAQLRAIEDDRLEALPAEAYARGFVRTYAEYLNLNGDDVVAIFNEQWNRTAGHAAESALPQTPVSVARRTPTGLFSLSVAMACLLLVGSAVVYLTGGSGGGHAAPPSPTTHPPATSPATTLSTSATQSPPLRAAGRCADDGDRGAGQLLAGGTSRLRERGTAGRADAGAGPGRAPARPSRLAAAGGSDQRPAAGKREDA